MDHRSETQRDAEGAPRQIAEVARGRKSAELEIHAGRESGRIEELKCLLFFLSVSRAFTSRNYPAAFTASRESRHRSPRLSDTPGAGRSIHRLRSTASLISKGASADSGRRARSGSPCAIFS